MAKAPLIVIAQKKQSTSTHSPQPTPTSSLFQTPPNGAEQPTPPPTKKISPRKLDFSC